MAAPNPVAQSIVQNLSNQAVLLMKMRMLSLGKNYDVMDQQQRVLCQIGLDAKQNVAGQLLGSAVGSLAGSYVGRYVARSQKYTYDVKDPGGNLALQIQKGSGGNRTSFSIVDPSANVMVGRIDMQRSLFGGLKATWVSPQGQAYLATKGNIMRRKYEMLGPDGRSWGRVRHKILAIRDVWQLELDPQVNHLYSAIFATILDFEKKM